MDRLTIEYCGEYVPRELCSIDRLGGADDCDLCCEYCKATEEGNEDCKGCAINKCFNKLAGYEDFEEIFRSKMTDGACDFLKDKEEFAKWLDRNKWIAKKCDEYARAEEQGRLLELPCAVDSEVWYIDKYSDLYIEIVRGVVDGYLWHRSCGFSLDIVWDKPIMGHFGYKRRPMPFSEIGKTIFLSRESAEATLKQLEG